MTEEFQCFGCKKLARFKIKAVPLDPAKVINVNGVPQIYMETEAYHCGDQTCALMLAGTLQGMGMAQIEEALI